MTDDEVRDKMGEALCRVPRVWTGDFGPYEIADALLPVVREVAAEAIKVAANDVYMPYETRMDLHDRADALEVQRP